MGFDPFAEAANVKTRSSGGVGGGFKPGYPLIRLHHIRTRDNKERVQFQPMYGKDGNRWVDNSGIWGIGVFGFGKKSEEEQTEMFKGQIVSLFKSVVVQTEKDKYETLFAHCQREGTGKGAGGWVAWAEAVCEEANKLAKKGKLFVRTVNRLRAPEITQEHVTIAKNMLKSWEMSGFYNGATGFVLFDQWKEVEGKTPGPRKLPEKFPLVDAQLQEIKGGGSKSTDTGSSDAPPAEDDDDIPF